MKLYLTRDDDHLILAIRFPYATLARALRSPRAALSFVRRLDPDRPMRSSRKEPRAW